MNNTVTRLRPNRRHFLAALGMGGAFYTVPGAFAQQLVLTPAQTLGPFYPDRLPLDQDNDLLVLNDNITPGVGQISWVYGRVLDRRGSPLRGALVEIWQADNNGAYIHSSSPIANRDANFQGYGRFLTGSGGEYLFRTVKPGIYPGRTRHIHCKVTLPGGQTLVTQLYTEGEALNTNDGVLNGIRDTAQRASVIVPWTAVPGSAIGELAAKFDIIVDFTPADNPTPARPTLVAVGAVVNGATFHPGAAAGSWITLYGDALAPVTRTWTAADIVNGKLPESLDGVSVRVNNQPASVYYISPAQLNVQAPGTAGTGAVQVTVTTPAGTSDPVTVPLQDQMPGFFQLPQEYAAAVHADGVYIGPAGLIDGVATVPAKPGDQIILFGTGFGATNPAIAAGQSVTSPAPLASPVTIRIDTVTANVSFAGLVSPGLYQFNLTVPDLPDGDHAVVATVSGVRTAKAVRLRMQRQASAAAVAPAHAGPESAADKFVEMMNLVAA